MRELREQHEREADRDHVRHHVDAVRPREPEAAHDDRRRARARRSPALFHITWFSAAADGSSVGGTRFGVIAERVGIDIDVNAALRAAARIGARAAGRPSTVPTRSMRRRQHEPDLRAQQDPRAGRGVSISGPTASDTTTIGTSCTRPTAPTAADDSGHRSTWTNNATSVIWLPTCEIISPNHSNRKSRGCAVAA